MLEWGGSCQVGVMSQYSDSRMLIWYFVKVTGYFFCDCGSYQMAAGSITIWDALT